MNLDLREVDLLTSEVATTIRICRSSASNRSESFSSGMKPLSALTSEI